MTGVIDFPNCMSKFVMLGIPLDQVIAQASLNARKIFPVFRGRGSLSVGAPRDIAMLDLAKSISSFLTISTASVSANRDHAPPARSSAANTRRHRATSSRPTLAA